MVSYPQWARERAMKVEEVILRVASGQSTFWQAVRVLNRSPRHAPSACPSRAGAESVPRKNILISACGTFTRSCARSTASATAIPASSSCCKVRGWCCARKLGPHRRRRERRPMTGN